MNSSYQERALAGATGIELIIALYDAAIRFLYRAIDAVDENDTPGRRAAVKKFVDVVMYLQARLRPELGPEPAAALSDFYTAMFTMALEASHSASKEKFDATITCVRNVRDAWVVASHDPAVGRVLPRELRTREERYMPTRESAADSAGPAANRWSA